MRFSRGPSPVRPIGRRRDPRWRLSVLAEGTEGTRSWRAKSLPRVMPAFKAEGLNQNCAFSRERTDMTSKADSERFTGTKLCAMAIIAMLTWLPAYAGSEDHMQPGLWVTTWTVELPDVGTPPLPMARVQCISQEKSDADPVPELNHGECQVTAVHRAWEKISWKLDCGTSGKGSGAIVYQSATDYKGWMSLKANGGSVRTKIRGWRVGGC